VHPGGDPDAIHITYKGATQLQQQPNGAITATTPMGSITESNLYAYKQEDGSPINATYQLEDNIVRCRVPDYTGTLVLDPWLDWGTYFGGFRSTLSQNSVVDNTGNCIIYGYTSSSSNIATVGAYQTSAGSDTDAISDAFLAKFNTNGRLLWATYYGYGSSTAYATVDNEGSIYVTGQTGGRTGISTPGTFDTVFSGFADGYLGKFDSSGSLLWGTYIGDTNMTWGAGVSCDNAGNVYVGGQTNCLRNIVTPDCFQDSLGLQGGSFLMRLSGATGTRIWGTYTGCAIHACACDALGHIIIVGDADSGVYLSPGCMQDSCCGGYIAQFDSNGHVVWSTYYATGKSTDFDPIEDIVCDDIGNIYLTGYTDSPNSVPVTSGVYQPTFGGGLDCFVGKLNSSGNLQWGTYYGGSLSDYGSGIAVDGVGNVYVTGTTASLNNIATAGSYIDTFTRTLFNAFISIFNDSGMLKWGSYFGADTGYTGGYGISVDHHGNIFCSGYSASPDGLASGDAHQDVNLAFSAGDENAFLVKFDTAATGIKSVRQTEQNFSLSPNPNHGNYTISGTVANDNAVMIAVYNMLGQVVLQQKDLPHNGKLQAVFSAPQLLPGVYLVQLSNSATIANLRMVVE